MENRAQCRVRRAVRSTGTELLWKEDADLVQVLASGRLESLVWQEDPRITDEKMGVSIVTSFTPIMVLLCIWDTPQGKGQNCSSYRFH